MAEPDQIENNHHYSNKPAPHPGISFKPYANVPRDELDAAILAEMAKNKTVGLSAAFVRDGHVVWARGYGWADLEKFKPAAPDTIYRIASISKTFAATALMQLWERGLFDLDGDIGQFLGYPVRNPGYPGDRVTFKMLLTHTSGLLDGGGYEQALASPRPPLLKDLLLPGGRACSGRTWGSFKPGTKFSYSNFGTGIIGALVEALSGERFDRYVQNHIFRPLKMDAGYSAADLAGFPRLAVLYQAGADGRFHPACDHYPEGQRPQPGDYKLPPGNYYIGPAGGVRTSVLDLAKFMLLHLNGGIFSGTRLLQSATVDLMQQIHFAGNGLAGVFKYGLGFQITDALAGRRLTGHAGEAYGLLSDLFFDRKEKTGVILITNGGCHHAPPDDFAGIEAAVIEAIFAHLAGRP